MISPTSGCFLKKIFKNNKNYLSTIAFTSSLKIDNLHHNFISLQPGAITMSCVATLKEKGLKLTPQRILIADIIHDANGYLTAELIIARVQVKMPGVNKSTVYRTLELLEGAGCLYRSELGDKFIYHHEAEGHHHHLVCSRCGKAIDCDENIFAPLQRSLKEKYEFEVDFKQMVMNGVCAECRDQEGLKP